MIVIKNPDIEETRTFMAIAREMIEHCDLEDICYSDNYYALLNTFADASCERTIDEMTHDFPVLTLAMTFIDNDILNFNWPAAAQAIDILRDKNVVRIKIG